MSVLKKFGEMAILLTFIIFCINGMLFFFGDAFITEPEIPLGTLTSDINTTFDPSYDDNGTYILQAATLGTRPVDIGYVTNAVLTLSVGFPLKLIAILVPYGLENIGIFIGLILGIIQVIGIIYLGLALIGTPLGGSIP